MVFPTPKLMKTPAPVAPGIAWPPESRPMRFPSTTLSSGLSRELIWEITIWLPRKKEPVPSLPTMTLPAPEAAPPIVFPVVATKIPMLLPSEASPVKP
jgi:hypothetical protein